MNSRELDRSPSTLNFGGGSVSRTLAERAAPNVERNDRAWKVGLRSRSAERCASATRTCRATTRSQPRGPARRDSVASPRAARRPRSRASFARSSLLGSTATVTMPVSATLSAPAPGATNVDATTEFAWSKVDGLAYVSAYPESEAASATAPTFHVLTAGTSVRLPNVSSFGVAVASGKSYAWSVIHYPLVASPDALTAQGTLTNTARPLARSAATRRSACSPSSERSLRSDVRLTEEEIRALAFVRGRNRPQLRWGPASRAM